MEFSKVRNSTRIAKILSGILFIFNLINPATAQVLQPNTGGVFLPQQYPTNFPQNYPNTGQVPVMGRDAQPNNKAVKQGTVRDVELTEEDEEAMTHEDSVKVANETIENENLALTAYRRRIIGHKLFGDVKMDVNSALNIATPNNYVLGPNDHLIIDIYGYSQFQQEVVVSADGYVTLSRAGLVKVGGLNILDAKNKIRQAFSKVFLGLSQGNTYMNLSLGNVRSIKVNINGEVVAPGTYTVTSLTSILNALYACGGPNEIGTYRKVNLIRNNNVVATLDLYDVLMAGSSNKNLLLQEQDIIQVGTYTTRVAIEGNTKRKGLLEMLPGETLSKAVFFAGGFDQNAYTEKIKVYRNTSREKKILDVPKSEFEDFLIQSGDSIVVSQVLERFENMIRIEGAVFRPGEYSLENSPTLLTLINAAEGFRGDALLGRINILRTKEDLTIENIALNVADIINKKSEDFILKREDQIIVPSIFELTEEATVKIKGAINNEDAEEGVEITYVKEMTLEDALVKVGGLTEAASRSKIEIVRRRRNVNPNEANSQISDIIEVAVNANFELNQKDSKIVLMPFDEIFIRSSPNYKKQSLVMLEGEVLYPSTYGIKSKEDRISDIIQRAGGITPQAYVEGATLVRTVKLSELELQLKKKTLDDLQGNALEKQEVDLEEEEATRKESIGINLSEILKNPGGLGDLILKDGDLIKIPTRLETVRIQGEVLYPVTVKYMRNAAFKEYISGAGGFTNGSLKKRSYVLYANGSVDRTRKFLFFNLYPRVEPGSEIIIPARVQNTQEQLTQVNTIVGTVTATVTAIVSLLAILQLTK